MRTESKSQTIRDYIAANPDATASQVMKAMKKERVKVSKPLVYKLLSDEKKKPVSRRAANGTGKQGASSVTVNALLETKKLTQQLGSIEEVHKALDLLAKLNS